MDEVAIEEQKKFEEVFQGKVMNLAQKGCRASVRAESYDHNKKGNFNVKVIKKTEEQKSLIRERIINSFLFNNLEENELKNVIDAMGERKFKYIYSKIEKRKLSLNKAILEMIYT